MIYLLSVVLMINNINLHREDGIFIGQFGQDEEWNIYKTISPDKGAKINEAKIKPYGTYAKNERLEKFLRGELEIEDLEEDKDEQEDDGYLDSYKKGYTVANASSLLGYHPKKVKAINSDKYFDAIMRLKPNYHLKREDMKKFFKKMVGVDQDHYKDLIKQIQQ